MKLAFAAKFVGEVGLWREESRAVPWSATLLRSHTSMSTPLSLHRTEPLHADDGVRRDEQVLRSTPEIQEQQDATDGKCPSICLTQNPQRVTVEPARPASPSASSVISDVSGAEDDAFVGQSEVRSLRPCLTCLSSFSQTRESFIRGFFSNYDGFTYDETKDALEQFHLLADHMGWEAPRTEEAHAHLQDAMVLQFNAMYGSDESSLHHWQFICQILHVFRVPTDIETCKEARLFLRTAASRAYLP
jgi:hypothetical protein